MSGVKVIEDNSLRATPSGFEVRVRFKWYRSLPLSCLEDLRLSIDGEPVDPGLIKFHINGHVYRLSELTELVEENWFVLDPAILEVELPGKVKPGEPHQIDISFGMRAPYIRTGPGDFLTVINRGSATQVAA